MHSIRLATTSDTHKILSIYAPYITDTAISFETAVPSVSEFSYRIEMISQQYPFLVYTIDEEIVGYAYASKHRERAAYLFDVDVSIYISPDYHGSGMAHKLYECLFAILNELGYKNAYAAYTEPNEKSTKFHVRQGFSVIGTHHNTGYKLGQWHDVTWLEKTIGTYEESPKRMLAITEFPTEKLNRIINRYVTV